MNFLKKLRPFDIVVIVLILAAIMVFFATNTGKRMTSSNQIEAETKVDIEVYFRGVVVTSKNSPFKEGDETFITIRNVPYTKLKIKSTSYERKKIMLPSGGSKYLVVEDLTSPFNYDFLVTLEDNAKITKDGAVVGGNKIKIGLPVTLEGKDYKLNGVVSNITVSKSAVENSDNMDLDVEVNKNQDVH